MSSTPPLERVTAARVRAHAERLASGLRARGIDRGDRVAILLPSSWQQIALVWACLGSDLIPVPLESRLGDAERSVIFEQVQPALVVDSAKLLNELIGPGRLSLRDVPRFRPMHATSGTTGVPKGVWSGWWSSKEAQAALTEERDLWRFDPSDVNLVVSPVHHSAPLRFALGTLFAGGSIVVLPGFTPDRFFEAVERWKPTTMFCVPTHLQRLLSHLSDGDPADVSSFRLVAHAGAPCPEPVRLGAHQLFGLDVVWEFYGSTEGQFTVCSAREWHTHGTGLGRARKHRRLIVDENDQLWCLGPSWARFAYWNDRERTAAAWQLTGDGPAFTVGDLGRVDPDGWVHLDSRRTDLIITGGVNVHPLEIEAVLEQVPGVVEVAVFGRDDPDWGQRVCAAVVGTADESALRDHAARLLAPPKRPKDYIASEGLPRTATGKVRRGELAELS